MTNLQKKNCTWNFHYQWTESSRSTDPHVIGATCDGQTDQCARRMVCPRRHKSTSSSLLSRTTWVSQYQKGKINLDFTEARDSEWHCYMQVCISSRQITMPAPHHSVFYRPDALPAAQPTASKHWSHQIYMVNNTPVKLQTFSTSSILVKLIHFCIISLCLSIIFWCVVNCRLASSRSCQ